VVLTILKNISQWEGLSHILWEIKNVPNHQPNNYYPIVTPSIPPAFPGISTIDPRHKVSCVDTCHQRARGHMVVQLEPSWASHETKKTTWTRVV
jgi:hypothetical protein